MHVALFGGSFNPPHVGHLIATTYVRATQDVDEVWWIPSWNHPFGKTLTSFEHRVAMCRAIAADTSGWLKISEVEKELGGEGRTVDTLLHLHKVHPGTKFTLVIGSDIVKDLPKWKRFDEVQRLARVLVLYRAGHPAEGAVGPPLVEVSSTEIREKFARGASPSELVPRAALDYAVTHQLYR